MPNFPVEELPTGGGISGGGRIPPHRPGIEELPVGPPYENFARQEAIRLPHRPGIAELPAGPNYYNQTMRALVREVFNLRQRVYKLESSSLFAGFGMDGVAAEYWPNELPAELELGGSGGGGYRPRPGEINELPQISVLQQIANVETRLATLESSLLSAVQALTAKVENLQS